MDYEPSDDNNDYESHEEDCQGTSKEDLLNIVQKISVTPGLNASVGIVKNVTNMVSEENSVTENCLPIIHHPTPYPPLLPHDQLSTPSLPWCADT